jgi:hypothetical protein
MTDRVRHDDQYGKIVCYLKLEFVKSNLCDFNKKSSPPDIHGRLLTHIFSNVYSLTIFNVFTC